MKHLIVLTSLILALISATLAQETVKEGFSYGILYMAGGRYDNVRMCVATGGGVKGGPVADTRRNFGVFALLLARLIILIFAEFSFYSGEQIITIYVTINPQHI